MSLFVGIEAVGLRHSAAVVSDAHGAITYATRRVGEPIILHSTDRILLRHRLFSLLRDVCEGTGATLNDLEESTICIGMAGIAFESEFSEVKREFDRLEIKVKKLICRPDSEVILLSHLRSTEGSVLVCGSGATVLVSHDGRCFRSGGWGPAIGENGSGYWIGRQAIAAIASEYSRRDNESLLWSELNHWLQTRDSNDYPDVTELGLRWLEYLEQYDGMHAGDSRSLFLAFISQASIECHHAWRCMVSTFAQPVISAGAKGDSAALQILDNAVGHLSRQYIASCDAANQGSAVLPIVMYGGVFNHNPEFRIRVEAALENHYGRQLTFVGTGGALRPACGALLLALGQPESSEIRLPPPEVIQNVQASVKGFETSLGGLVND